MPQGHWYEVVMHVHWAADNSGQIQTWFRQKGQTGWTQSASYGGHPTVQWEAGSPCCVSQVSDKIGAYRGYSTAPVSVWLDGVSTARTWAGVASTLP
jgi:hypothetical protein